LTVHKSELAFSEKLLPGEKLQVYSISRTPNTIDQVVNYLFNGIVMVNVVEVLVKFRWSHGIEPGRE
jgi:hypothetical protein